MIRKSATIYNIEILIYNHRNSRMVCKWAHNNDICVLQGCIKPLKLIFSSPPTFKNPFLILVTTFSSGAVGYNIWWQLWDTNSQKKTKNKRKSQKNKKRHKK